MQTIYLMLSVYIFSINYNMNYDLASLERNISNYTIKISLTLTNHVRCKQTKLQTWLELLAASTHRRHQYLHYSATVLIDR